MSKLSKYFELCQSLIVGVFIEFVAKFLVLQKYCVDLESLKNHQIKEKEETLGTIQKLEAENQTYKNKLSNYSLKLDIPEQSNEISSKLNKIHTFVGEVLKSVEKCKVS